MIENPNSRRSAIVCVPMKLAVSLIFAEKNQPKISMQVFYRGNLVDFKKCEILGFSYNWHYETLDFKICSPDFAEAPEFSQAYFCEVRTTGTPTPVFFHKMPDEKFFQPSLKEPNPFETLPTQAAEKKREMDFEKELAAAVENLQAFEIHPQQIKIKNGLAEAFLRKYSKSENPEPTSDEPEFLSRETES